MSSRLTLESVTRARSAVALGALILLAAGSCAREPSTLPLPRSILLYEEGRFEESLALLRADLESGADGALLYRVGFVEHLLDADHEKKMRTWGEAERLLEAEIATEGNATLERLYYLSKINAEQYDHDVMRRSARLAVEKFEDEGDPVLLSGADWYRLGYLHELMNDASRAEAAYRRAGSIFEKQSGGQEVYRALASALIADLDFDGGRYERAAGAYDRAVSLAPVLNLVHPFQHGLALFGAGRFDEAITRFEEVQAGDGHGAAGADPEVLFRETQYAADLARMAVEAGGVVGEDIDETPFTKMLDEVLLSRIRDSARAYRGVREKYAYRPGDPLPSEMKAHQRRFVALLRERLIRDAVIIEFLRRESISDLVRP